MHHGIIIRILSIIGMKKGESMWRFCFRGRQLLHAKLKDYFTDRNISVLE